MVIIKFLGQIIKLYLKNFVDMAPDCHYSEYKAQMSDKKTLLFTSGTQRS